MRKILYLAVVLSVILAISGCITVKKTVRERVDQDLTIGNRGVIQGEKDVEPSPERKTDREYIDIRVEIPTVTELGFGTKAEKATVVAPAPVTDEETATVEDFEEPVIPEKKSKYIK